MHILYGSRPSFYTRKAWAAMRLLGLEVDDRLKTLAVKAEVEAAVGGYHRFPVVQCPDGEWMVDSTVIGVTLSVRHRERTLTADWAPLGTLILMAEDWMDEWLLRAAVLWRATHPATRRWVADVGARNLFGLHQGDPVPDTLAGKLEKATANVEGFFVSAGAINGVTPDNQAEIAAFAARCVDVLNDITGDSRWLAGDRMSLADAALWGFLDAGLLWEPEPAAQVRARAPALTMFHRRLGAMAKSGVAPTGEWGNVAEVAVRLLPLLYDGLGYADFLNANAAACRTLAAGGAVAGIPFDNAMMAVRRHTDGNRRSIGNLIRGMDADDREIFDLLAGDWPLTQAYLME